MIGCKSRKKAGNIRTWIYPRFLKLTQAFKWDFYRADSSNAGPVRLLVHPGRLVDLAEEEVDLLLVL